MYFELQISIPTIDVSINWTLSEKAVNLHESRSKSPSFKQSANVSGYTNSQSTICG